MKKVILFSFVSTFCFGLALLYMDGNMPKEESDHWAYDDDLSKEDNARSLQEFLSKIEIKKPEYPNPMLPPWKQFPKFHRASMGWRMGGGEGYLTDFMEWFRALPEQEQTAYMKKEPEPKEWQEDGIYPGFYKMTLQSKYSK